MKHHAQSPSQRQHQHQHQQKAVTFQQTVPRILSLLLLVQGGQAFQQQPQQYHDQETPSLRSLRGGSYSRGGSRSSGGYYHSSSSTSSSTSARNSATHNSSSGNRNRSQNGNNNTNANRGARRSRMGHVLGGLMFAGLGLALLAILFPAAMGGCCLPLLAGLCCSLAASQLQSQPRHLQSSMNDNNKNDNRYHPEYCSQDGGGNDSGDYYATQESGVPITTNNAGNPFLQFPESSSPLSDTDFEHCARRAKQEVEGSSFSIDDNHKSPSCTPFSGSYATSYVDRTTGVQHDATLQIFFSPDFYGRGYKLSGQGHDIDGPTVIEEGHVNYNGTAWWNERTISGDVGLKVVSRGTFDFSQGTFQGTWLANSGEQGAYIQFRALVAGAGEVHSSTFNSINKINKNNNREDSIVMGTVATSISSSSAQHHTYAMPPRSDTIPVVTASQVASSSIHTQSMNGGSHVIPIVYGTPVTQPTTSSPYFPS